MTHTPTLPNGFSRDAESVFAKMVRYKFGCFPRGTGWTTYPQFSHPTPGDAVLKELAEKANG